VLKAAGNELSSQFYAELYVGLYYDALNDASHAREHLSIAASNRFADAGGYMYRVATLHPRIRKNEP
jgi:hypothetical protein